jgi:hypothetical protein
VPSIRRAAVKAVVEAAVARACSRTRARRDPLANISNIRKITAMFVAGNRLNP